MVGATTTSLVRYVYDGMDIKLEFDGGGTLLARYNHGDGIDQPLMMERMAAGGQVAGDYYYHTDHLGSVRHLSNSLGTKINSYKYDSFGNFTELSETVKNPYTFTGREYDSESGMYYYRARYYDPRMGRFISEDPIGFGGRDVNFYRYVKNRPVNKIDPFGLLDYFAGGEVDIVPIVGVEGGIGVVFDSDNFLDSGVYYGGGVAYGANVGASVGAGVCREIEGEATNIDLNIIVGSPVIILDEKGISGFSGGLGRGYGASVSHTNTRTLTIRDVINWIKSWF